MYMKFNSQLKTVSRFLMKLKAIWFSNPQNMCYPKSNENIFSLENLYHHNYDGFIHSHQKLEA